MRLVAAAADALGGYSPITGDELRMLRRDISADIGRFVARFGFTPVPSREGTARRT